MAEILSLLVPKSCLFRSTDLSIFSSTKGSCNQGRSAGQTEVQQWIKVWPTWAAAQGVLRVEVDALILVCELGRLLAGKVS